MPASIAGKKGEKYVVVGDEEVHTSSAKVRMTSVMLFLVSTVLNEFYMQGAGGKLAKSFRTAKIAIHTKEAIAQSVFIQQPMLDDTIE